MILAPLPGNCALQAGKPALGAPLEQRPQQTVADSALQASC